MEIIDYIVIGVIALIVGAAIVYIIKEKKKGKKCIGCPYCSSCTSKKSGECGN
ncbi:MAG: FeoB-associated Cys-rich membrane protein [Clostridia bacterium]|nr:FeoB-associated Cys-rich membrane protein [Clostridia bacterium]